MSDTRSSRIKLCCHIKLLLLIISLKLIINFPPRWLETELKLLFLPRYSWMSRVLILMPCVSTDRNFTYSNIYLTSAFVFRIWQHFSFGSESGAQIISSNCVSNYHWLQRLCSLLCCVNRVECRKETAGKSFKSLGDWRQVHVARRRSERAP